MATAALAARSHAVMLPTADQPKGRRYRVVYRADDAPSVAVPLGG